MRLLVCGSRDWDEPEFIYEELDGWLAFGVPLEIVEGCARGADTIAEEWTRARNQQLWHWPADWNKYGKRAGPIRNQNMLATKPDIVLAFHHDLANSKGTLHMVGIARTAGVPVKVFG